MTFKALISGYDTIECAYYLLPTDRFSLDYIALGAEKEALARQTKNKQKPIQLGSEEFMLASHGTGSGYPFLIENDLFSIQFGEFNKPNFFVKLHIAEELIEAGHGQVRCFACEKIYSVSELERKTIGFPASARSGWIYANFICPAGHSLLLRQVMHIMRRMADD